MTFPMKQSLTLLLASVAWLGLGITAMHAQDGKVTPFELCQTYNPLSGKLNSVLSYDNTNSNVQRLEPGSLSNYFTPGEFDLGQPSFFFPGTDHDLFAIDFRTSDTDKLVWLLSPYQGAPLQLETKLPIFVSSAPPCTPSYFQPAPTLVFSGPGTYTHQLLGQLTFSNSGFTAKIYPFANGSNLSFTNLAWTTNSSYTSNGVTSYQQPVQFLYGDVTVGPGNAATTNLLVQVSDAGGRQVALGTDTVQFSGTPANTAGCPTDVTSSVQGTKSAPVQLFGTQIWTQLVTIKNTSGVAIPGPIQLALTNLSGNARLFTAAGTGSCPGFEGAPYIPITNGLAPNANGAVVLTFTNSTVPTTAITYTPVVVAGGSRL